MTFSAGMQKNRLEWLVGGRGIFVVFCTYYIFATYLLPSIGSIERFSPAYMALVIPGWIFVWLNRRVLLNAGWIPKLWWVFIAAVMLVALIQWSGSLAYNGLYIGLVAIAIVNSGGYLRTEELNAIFLATIVGSVIVYYLGVTEYGFLPGQADATSCHHGLGFRVSLFRIPSESAALSFFVLLWNTFLPPQGSRWRRWLAITLAVYFLAFSGIRTAVIALLIVSPVLIYRLMPIRVRWARSSAALMIPAVVVMTSFYLLAAQGGGRFGSEFLASYLLRADSCEAVLSNPDDLGRIEIGATIPASRQLEEILVEQGTSVNWLSTTINRHCAGIYQLRLFLKHPFIGNKIVHPNDGDDPEIAVCTKSTMQRYCDACVLSTYWLSRGGGAGVALIAIFCATLWIAVRKKSTFGIIALVAFGLIMQGWGVMFTPYNFTFYMLASLVPLIGISGSREKRAG